MFQGSENNRWDKIRNLVAQAFELDGENLEAFLRQIGEDDETIRLEVESFLRMDKEAMEDGFLTETMDYGLSGTSESPQMTERSEESDSMSNQPDPLEFSSGQQLGQYEIVRSIGSGQFANVYLATDLRLRRQVALKVPLAGSIMHHGGYIEEARKAASLDHPGIVPIYGIDFLDDDRPLVAMKFVEGTTLAERLKSGRIECEQAMRLVAKLADGLAHAHRQNLTHRDLKPANILLDASDSPLIADFGLALSESDQPLLRGDCSGTPMYRSPEQVRGESHWIDGRSDIWSLGVIFYEMLTGRFPFAFDNLSDLDEQILARTPKPPSMIDASITDDAERICLKCLCKNREDRYNSASILRKDLLNSLKVPRKSVPRQIGVAVTSVVLTVLLVWTIFNWLSSDANGLDQDHLGLRLSVQRDGSKRVPVEQVLPLRSGDFIQASWQVPPNCIGGIVGIDSDGIVHDMTDQCMVRQRHEDGSAEYVWPIHREDEQEKEGLLELIDPPGTEALFVFAWPREKEKNAHGDGIGSLSALPDIAPMSVVYATNSAPKTQSGDAESRTQDRGFGSTKVSSQIDVENHANRIKAKLEASYEMVEGIVFPHVKTDWKYGAEQ